LKKNEVPTGRINVIGVSTKEDALPTGRVGKYLEDLAARPYDHTVNIILLALANLHKKKMISDFDFIISLSYFTTDLVYKTIAERIMITDTDNIRYMSKQNVHQNVVGKVVIAIKEYIKKYMPNEVVYFKNKLQEIGNGEEETKEQSSQRTQLRKRRGNYAKQMYDRKRNTRTKI
jgi:hypothetical protein